MSYPLGTVKEVAAVRGGVGLFDVSHMGEVRVTGLDAFDFVQRMTTNNVHKLVPGKAQYSLLLNEAGAIIDDIIVYQQAPQDFMIVLNAGCKDKDLDWLSTQADRSLFSMHGRMDDISDQTALLAVQGPNAVDTVAKLSVPEIATLKRFEFGTGFVSGIACTISRTGYTGDDGFELFCRWNEAPALWEALTNAGAVPCGLGARDVLRLEAAYPLYGHELDDTHLPAESGVGWAVKPRKGAFIGRDANYPVVHAARRLVGLQMDTRAIPREHCAVLDTEGSAIGDVTSGTFSPTVQAGIAMARVNSNFAEVNTQVLVDIRGRIVSAHVVALPFYRNGV